MFEVTAAELVGLATTLEQDRKPVSLTGQWGLRYDNWQNCFAAFCEEPGATLTLRDVGGSVTIEFLQSAWSGVIEFSTGTETTTFDAFSPEHKPSSLRLSVEGVRDITIRNLAARNPNASGCQLWLWRVLFAQRPTWVRRDRSLTSTVDFVDADEGSFLTLTNDDVISKCIRVYGVWGRTQVEIFRRFVIPGSVAIDIGANIGHHTVTMAKLVGFKGKVYAFEPQRRPFRLLVANLALNLCDHVEAFDVALGEVAGSAHMNPRSYDDINHPWNVGSLGIAVKDGVLDHPNNGQEVSIRRLDDLLPHANVDFIKCDAQGFDYYVLRGAVKLIERSYPTILTEVAPRLAAECGVNYLQLYEFLKGLGYRLIDPETLKEHNPPRTWTGRPEEEWDVLAVHSSVSTF
jgi:FkbM family methyltransferase